MGRPSRSAWIGLAALVAVAAALWAIDKRNAALGTLVAALGCLALVLPPRERMAVLPAPLRALPRRLDIVPALVSLTSTPGYGLNWFYGANPYDEAVHLVNGVLLGLVLGAMLQADGRGWRPARLWLCGLGGGLLLGIGWEAFEWATGLIGSPVDTLSDIALTAGGAALGTRLAPAPARR
jgi:hypothetical protein